MAFVRILSAIIVLNVLLLHNQVSSFKLTKQQAPRSVTCPVLPKYDVTNSCSPRIQHFCVSDASCPKDTKCCPTSRDRGCSLMCVKPRALEGCPIPLDFAMIVDTSGSISRRDFKKLIDFIEDMVDGFDISEDGTHISVIEYSTKASVQIRFDDFSGAQLNGANLKRKVRKIPHSRGFTYIDKALQLANTDVFSAKAGMRPNVTKVAVVMTDGKQTVTEEGKLSSNILNAAVQPLKDKKVRMISLGIGKGANLFDLETIASSNNDVYLAENFAQLKGLVTRLTKNKCPEPDYKDQSTTPSPQKVPVCPGFPPPAECPTEQENYCENDSSCPSGLKCCNTGCVLNCVAPDYRDQRTPSPQKSEPKTQGFPVTPENRNCIIDLALIVEASGSVRNVFDDLLKFVVDVAKKINIGPKGSHIGLVYFGDQATKLFDFTEFEKTPYDEEAILNKIRNISKPQAAERSFINRGLRLANRKLLRTQFGMRPEVKQVALLISEGKQTSDLGPNEPRPTLVAKAMKRRGIEIQVLGIGSPDFKELSGYSPDPSLVLGGYDFSELEHIVIEQAKSLCPVSTTTVLPTTTPLSTTALPPKTTPGSTEPPTTTPPPSPPGATEKPDNEGQPTTPSPQKVPVCPVFPPQAECPPEHWNYCRNDSSCPSGLKCCNTGCGLDCVAPDYKDQRTTPSPQKNEPKTQGSALTPECQEESAPISVSQVRASSQWDVNHAAIQGRLDFQETSVKAGAWAAATKDVNQWLQVDLVNQHTKVSRVATQGRDYSSQWPWGPHSQWVTKYKLQYSDDGVTFQYYREQGQSKDKEFDGNTDRNTAVYHELHPPVRARYFRFQPTAWHGHISLRVELYGCREPDHKDKRTTPSPQKVAVCPVFPTPAECPSEVDNFCTDDSSCPSGLKCCNTGCELDCVAPDYKDQRTTPSPQKVPVCPVFPPPEECPPEQETYCKNDSSCPSGLKCCNTGCGLDCVAPDYKNQRTTPSPQKNEPKTQGSAVTPECQEALGMESGAISDSQLSASSAHAIEINHAAIQGRLNFQETSVKAGAWVAAPNDFNQWLQVDMGNQFTKVSRVATQGRDYSSQWPWGHHRQWVTKYKLQYSDDGVNFQYYREQGQSKEKEFDGNTDRNTVVYHDLHPPIRARYFRFRPTVWHGNDIAMRVELYGCREPIYKDKPVTQSPQQVAVCPVFPPPAECPSEVEHFCVNDCSCSSGLKCCSTGCVLDCVVPTMIALPTSTPLSTTTLPPTATPEPKSTTPSPPPASTIESKDIMGRT